MRVWWDKRQWSVARAPPESMYSVHAALWPLAWQAFLMQVPHTDTAESAARDQRTQWKPYMSPVLSGAYRNRAWAVEIIIGSTILLLGSVFVILALVQSRAEFRGIGIGLVAVGLLIILLGLCWRKNLEKPDDTPQQTNVELNLLSGADSNATEQASVSTYKAHWGALRHSLRLCDHLWSHHPATTANKQQAETPGPHFLIKTVFPYMGILVLVYGIAKTLLSL